MSLQKERDRYLIKDREISEWKDIQRARKGKDINIKRKREKERR